VPHTLKQLKRKKNRDTIWGSVKRAPPLIFANPAQMLFQLAYEVFGSLTGNISHLLACK